MSTRFAISCVYAALRRSSQSGSRMTSVGLWLESAGSNALRASECSCCLVVETARNAVGANIPLLTNAMRTMQITLSLPCESQASPCCGTVRP